MTSVKQN